MCTNIAQQCLTSIADIILYPHESMVSFHPWNPSGITGSEFNSYMNETVRQTFLYHMNVHNKLAQMKYDLKAGVFWPRTDTPHVSPFWIRSSRYGWLKLFWHHPYFLLQFLVYQTARNLHSFRCNTTLHFPINQNFSDHS